MVHRAEEAADVLVLEPQVEEHMPVADTLPTAAVEDAVAARDVDAAADVPRHPGLDRLRPTGLLADYVAAVQQLLLLSREETLLPHLRVWVHLMVAAEAAWEEEVVPLVAVEEAGGQERQPLASVALDSGALATYTAADADCADAFGRSTVDGISMRAGAAVPYNSIGLDWDPCRQQAW